MLSLGLPDEAEPGERRLLVSVAGPAEGEPLVRRVPWAGRELRLTLHAGLSGQIPDPMEGGPRLLTEARRYHLEEQGPGGAVTPLCTLEVGPAAPQLWVTRHGEDPVPAAGDVQARGRTLEERAEAAQELLGRRRRRAEERAVELEQELPRLGADLQQAEARLEAARAAEERRVAELARAAEERGAAAEERVRSEERLAKARIGVGKSIFEIYTLEQRLRRCEKQLATAQGEAAAQVEARAEELRRQLAAAQGREEPAQADGHQGEVEERLGEAEARCGRAAADLDAARGELTEARAGQEGAAAALAAARQRLVGLRDDLAFADPGDLAALCGEARRARRELAAEGRRRAEALGRDLDRIVALQGRADRLLTLWELAAADGEPRDPPHQELSRLVDHAAARWRRHQRQGRRLAGLQDRLSELLERHTATATTSASGPHPLT